MRVSASVPGPGLLASPGSELQGHPAVPSLARRGLRKRPVESREAEGKAREGRTLLGTVDLVHEVRADFVKNAHTLGAAISARTH